MRLFSLLKNLILKINAMPKIIPVSIAKTITTSTSLSPTGIVIDIPANSYVCLTSTAVWGSGKPVSIQIGWDRSDEYAFSVGGFVHPAASATLSFYTDSTCTVGVSAQYATATRNIITLRGFIISLGGGYYLVGFLKGGVGYALIHLAERHYSLYPFGKEFTYRWKHARRWIHSFPKWIQDVLGDRKQFKGSKHSDLADIIFRWICVSVSKLQYRDNNAVLLFCSFNTRRKHIQGVQLQHSKQSTKHCNKFKHWISGSRILIRGGDSYAAI